MVTVALLVRLEAKPGKEAAVEAFLNSGLALVEDEPNTIAWFADSAWDHQRSEFLMLSRMIQEGRGTCLAKWLRP